MLSTQTLIIFVKNAELGKVKTRLAATVGNSKALDIYKQLLGYTRDVTLEIKAEKQVWYSAFVDKSDPFFNEGYSRFVQVEGGLGQKMVYAFGEAFRTKTSKVVIIGSDCAELEPEHIELAFTALTEKEVVIGPARDGGYYLLGMNQFYPELFEEISWSTSSVYGQTMKIINDRSLSVFELPELNDVDTFEDWVSVRENLKSYD